MFRQIDRHHQQIMFPLILLSGLLAWLGMLFFEVAMDTTVSVSTMSIILLFECSLVGVGYLATRNTRLVDWFLPVVLLAGITAQAVTSSHPFFFYLMAAPIGLAAFLLGTLGIGIVLATAIGLLILIAPHQAFDVISFLVVTATYSTLISHSLNAQLRDQDAYQRRLVSELEETRIRRGELVRLTQLLRQSQRNISKMNTQLAHAREAAEAARQMKAQFAANVSHELRTPINLIVGFSEVIATSPESYTQPLPSEYRADFHAVYRNARHLQSLINDILDISQIDADQMALMREFCSPATVMTEAANMIREVVQNKGLTFELTIPDNLPDISMDPVRIRQVILNLLANAIRFTEAGAIGLKASTQETMICFQVWDTGTGIDEAELGNVFEEFYQTTETSLEGGSGLGLALSRNFVRLHGGEMGVESEIQRGTTFWFTLPLLQRDTFAVPVGRHAKFSGKRVIVIVDDDPAIHQLFRGHIHSHEVICCQTDDEAQTTIQRIQPTAVIVPDDTTSLPSIIETISPGSAVIAVPMPSGRRTIQALGVQDYLVKPVSKENLLAAIDRLPHTVQSVLVIDDHQDIVRMFRRMLSGYHIQQANDGKAGLQILREGPLPDLVLLDIRMPGMDGFGVIRAMKTDSRLADVPIIVASARGASESLTRSPTGRIHIHRSDGFAPMELVRQVEAIVKELQIPHLRAPQ